MEMVETLVRGGADVTVVGPRWAASRFSKHRVGWLRDPGSGADGLCQALVGWAAPVDRPVLMYQTDEDLLLVSRHRAVLGAVLGFLMPSHDTVEALVDKSTFAALATSSRLPVPLTTVVEATADPPSDLRYPLIVKPRTRDDLWVRDVGGAKVAVVRNRPQLQELLQHLAHRHPRVLLQHQVVGPETAVESYHAYVDSAGKPVAEFTGRKLRTMPTENGFSTHLIITDAADVRRLGRVVVERLGLVGVVKVDVKRDDEGRLWILEVNPRFNLWHRLGAAAGVDLPALVAADLSGHRRLPISPARVGATWCHVPRDLLAARRQGTSSLQWLREAHGADVLAGLDPRDPGPFLIGRVLPKLGAKLRAAAGTRPEQPSGGSW